MHHPHCPFCSLGTHDICPLDVHVGHQRNDEAMESKSTAHGSSTPVYAYSARTICSSFVADDLGAADAFDGSGAMLVLVCSSACTC